MDFQNLRNRIFGWGVTKEPETKKKSLLDISSPGSITRQIQAITGESFNYIPLVRRQLGFREELKLDQVRANYPHLIKLLFMSAQDIVEGRFGQSLQEYAKSNIEALQQERVAWTLALVEFAKNNHNSLPELWNETPPLKVIEDLKNLSNDDLEKIIIYPIDELPPSLKQTRLILDALIKQVTIPKEYQKSLIWIFQRFFDNSLHPSHVMVNITLELEKQEPTLGRTIRAIMRVKKPTERSRALSSIVQHLANTKHSDRALTIVRSLKVAEKSSTMNSIIDTLFKQGKSIKNAPDSSWFEKAIAEAMTLPNQDDQDRMLQRLVAAASRYGDAVMAFETANKIVDQETRAYALSSAVQALLAIGRRKAALQLLPSITDVGAKEDAIGYIVKEINQNENYESVCTFLDTLPNPSEKRHGAKVLMSLLIPHNDTQHIDEIKQKYVLV